MLNHQLPYALFNLLHFYEFMDYSHSVSVKPQQPHSTIKTETAMMILRGISGYIQARVIGLSLHTVYLIVCISYGNTYRVIQKKVTIGIFSIMETTLNRNFFAIEITDQVLSLSKF